MTLLVLSHSFSLLNTLLLLLVKMIVTKGVSTLLALSKNVPAGH